MSQPAPSVETIRTLALVGPAAAGKTLLAEALLQRSGAIGAMGSVERGSTVSDHDPQEIKAQHSLQSSVMHLQHDGCRVHLIDTPACRTSSARACRHWRRWKPAPSSSTPPPASSPWRAA